MALFRRLTNLFRGNRVSRDIDREMAFHVSELMDELIERGMNKVAARREALRRFGHRGDLRERVWRVDVLGWVESLVADVRYAIRAMRANPGFTIVAVLSLGLGIGANTAIFSLINAVMLRSLPVQYPEELVRVRMQDGGSFTNPLWEAIRSRDNETVSTFAVASARFNLTTGGVVRRVESNWVSGSYFNTLGVGATVGRVIQPADDYHGCSGTAVLSHAFWEREYGADPGVVGQNISLNGNAFEIVGVAAPGFSGIHVGVNSSVFAPICTVDIIRANRGILEARSTWFISILGRMAPSATLGDVRNHLASIAGAVYNETVPLHWTADEQEDYRQGTLSAEPATTGLSEVRGEYSQALFVLLVVVAVVLAIACANVAQLLLARATARQREFALRLALGSGRARLARQLLTEGLLLALLGAAVGVLFARWSSELVVGYLSQGGDNVSLDLSLDLSVLAFTVGVALLTGTLFALAPAFRATRMDPQTTLRGSGRGLAGEPNQVFAKTIVVGQVALSLVLVVAAGLLVGSFRRLSTVDPGFRANGVLIVSAGWSSINLSEERDDAFPRELLEQVRAIPGVQSAGASLLVPIGGSAWNEYVVTDGFTPDEPRDALVWFNGVTDGFLETLQTPLIRGRRFSSQDRAGSNPVVIVNRTLVQRFFGEVDPLGRRISTSYHDEVGPAMEIVGVVEDAKYRSVDEEILATAYVPLEQTQIWGPGIDIILRGDGGPNSYMQPVTQAMRAVDPAISLEFSTLDDEIAESIARPRLLATLSGFFGALALLLAVIGLYGTISYSVARRRNEIGIRIALGAARTGMVRMVAKEAGRLVAVGIIIGSVAAFASTRLVAAFLYGVTASDPVTFSLSALMLAVAAMAAGMVPAWRAAGVDPMVTLREE